MALETLKGVTEIGGFKVDDGPDGSHVGSMPVKINHEENVIAFKIQLGPIKQYGTNGCQVDTLIHAAKKILEGLNNNFPSSYNVEAMSCLLKAIEHLDNRTKDREKRGVEGINQA